MAAPNTYRLLVNCAGCSQPFTPQQLRQHLHAPEHKQCLDKCLQLANRSTLDNPNVTTGTGGRADNSDIHSPPFRPGTVQGNSLPQGGYPGGGSNYIQRNIVASTGQVASRGSSVRNGTSYPARSVNGGGKYVQRDIDQPAWDVRSSDGHDTFDHLGGHFDQDI